MSSRSVFVSRLFNGRHFVRFDHRVSFYARKQNASRVFAIVWASVRPSVCPSIRLSHSWSVSKRCKLGSRNLHCGCPKVSSLSWQNFVPLGAGVPLERGRQRRVPPKKRHLAVIGSNNVKTVADRYIHASYHNKHWWQAFWIYQHRWPWTTLNPPKRGF